MTQTQPEVNPAQAAELKQRAANGEVKAKLAREYGISKTTLYEYLKGCDQYLIYDP